MRAMRQFDLFRGRGLVTLVLTFMLSHRNVLPNRLHVVKLPADVTLNWSCVRVTAMTSCRPGSMRIHSSLMRSAKGQNWYIGIGAAVRGMVRISVKRRIPEELAAKDVSHCRSSMVVSINGRWSLL